VCGTRARRWLFGNTIVILNGARNRTTKPTFRASSVGSPQSVVKMPAHFLSLRRLALATDVWRQGRCGAAIIDRLRAHHLGRGISRRSLKSATRASCTQVRPDGLRALLSSRWSCGAWFRSGRGCRCAARQHRRCTTAWPDSSLVGEIKKGRYVYYILLSMSWSGGCGRFVPKLIGTSRRRVAV
jgi:hypothetical protein